MAEVELSRSTDTKMPDYSVSPQPSSTLGAIDEPPQSSPLPPAGSASSTSGPAKKTLAEAFEARKQKLEAAGYSKEEVRQKLIKLAEKKQREVAQKKGLPLPPASQNGRSSVALLHGASSESSAANGPPAPAKGSYQDLLNRGNAYAAELKKQHEQGARPKARPAPQRKSKWLQSLAERNAKNKTTRDDSDEKNRSSLSKRSRSIEDEAERSSNAKKSRQLDNRPFLGKSSSRDSSLTSSHRLHRPSQAQSSSNKSGLLTSAASRISPSKISKPKAPQSSRYRYRESSYESSDMEGDAGDILEEEERSLRLAKKEDEEAAREEERLRREKLMRRGKLTQKR